MAIEDEDMSASFDLRDQPWLPVRLAGRPARLGLRDLFHRAHEIEDVELPIPPAASGLLRILVAMTVRIADVDGERLDDPEIAESTGDWFDLRSRILDQGHFDGAAVDAYFDDPALAGRFDLFGAESGRPFLQDSRLVEECIGPKGEPNPSGVNKLALGRPTGVNGAVLFGHFTDTDPMPIPAAEAAWHLIAQLYYGPSGQCTPRRITDHKPGNGDAGPLRKTVSFHPWGPNLFTTLVLGLPRPAEGGEDQTGGEDHCPWEDEEIPDPMGKLPLVSGPGRLLTGRSRHAVLLVPTSDGRMVKDAYITWSTHEPPHAASDPYLVYDTSKNGGPAYPRPADGQRAVWRDIDALLRKTTRTGSRRPRILDDMAEEIPHALSRALRVRVYGFDQDGQQRDASWYEATTPPVLRWLEEVDPAMSLHIERCHRAAEEIGTKLDYAARLAWKLTTDTSEDPSAKVKLDAKKPGPWASAALAVYWPAAERIFWDLATPEHLDEPSHPLFAQAALDALDKAIGAARSDLRAARARHRARAVIRNAVPTSPTIKEG
ncbi:type I-E CRISPR-associated protein Cse1/CasA [Streptomyces olivoreticuli]